MRQALRALLACGAGFAVSLIAACGGGGGLLSSDQAGTLHSQLQTLQASYQSGQCGSVTNDSQGLINAADAVQSVNPGLQHDLTTLASSVAQSATTQCHQTRTTTSTPTSSSSSSSSTSTPTSSTSSSTSTSTSPSTSSTSSSTTTSGTSTTSSGTTSTGPTGGTGVGGGGNGQ